MGCRVEVTFMILVSAPVPLVLIWVLNLVGVGPRGLRTKDLGTGIANFTFTVLPLWRHFD